MSEVRRELEHFYIGSSYGGNQDWFRTFMMRIGGCGAETACDSSIYFAMHGGVRGIYPFDINNLSRYDYIEFAHMMERYLWPRMTGIDKLDIFVEGYGNYLRDRGVTGLSMGMLSGSEPVERAAAAVRSQIDAGYPIPTLVLNHRSREYRDYVWHWFLINGYRFNIADDDRSGFDTYSTHPDANSLHIDTYSTHPDANSLHIDTYSSPLDTDSLPLDTGSSRYEMDKLNESAGARKETAPPLPMQVKAVTYSGYRWLNLERLWDTGYSNKGGLILYSKSLLRDA